MGENSLSLGHPAQAHIQRFYGIGYVNHLPIHGYSLDKGWDTPRPKDSKAELFKAIIEMEHSKGAEKAAQAAKVTPHLTGILEIITSCIRDVGFPVDHRLWTEILAVAGRDSSVRETFAASDKAMRSVFVELLQQAALAGEIDSELDFDAMSICLFALVDGLIARTADDPCFNFEKQRDVLELMVRRVLCPAKA